MRPATRRITLALLIASLGLGLGAQYYLVKKSPPIWDGVFLYLVAILVFVWASARLEARPAREEAAPSASTLWQELWQALRCSPLRLAVLAVGVGIAVSVTSASSSRAPNQPCWDLLAFWAVAIVVVISSLADWAALPALARRVWAGLRKPSPELVLIAALALATFLLRAVNLNGIPFVLSGDEAEMGMEAVAVLEGRRTNPFVTGWLSHPTLFFFMQAGFLRLLGVTVQALRLPSAIISGLTVIFFYLLARRLFGRLIAIGAAIYFTAYHYGIHFGRLAINNIWDPFFAVASFYFLIRGMDHKRLSDMLAAGVFLGLAVYFYMGARLIPIILLTYLAYNMLRARRFLRAHLARLILCALVAFVIAMPILAFFRAHPNDMMARWNMMGIFPSGWVEQEMQRTGKTMLAVVFGQFLKAALAYNYYPDPTFWYHPGIPLLQFVASVFFIFGLTYAVGQWRKREYFLIVIWLLLVLIFGGMLLENPPTSPRLVLSIPPVVLLMTIGVVRVAGLLQRALQRSRETMIAATLIVVLALSYQSLHFYFGKYTPSHEFAGQNTEVADRLGKYLRVLGPGYQCYFFGPPRIYFRMATVPYLARGVEGMDVKEPIRDSVEFVNPDRDAVFVFLPERRNELDVVLRYYPSGQLREFRNQKNEILFVAYEVQL